MMENKFFWLFVFVTGIKILLMKAFYSTDFEVHRNWLAITHNLPISKWYYENTSQWTLDYPPFFGYFEWFLSQFAKYIDPEMLKIENLNYDSERTVIFQRCSVMISDLIYVFGIKYCLKALNLKDNLVFLIGSMLLLANVGLIMVDHIHFQYNGFLFGIMLFSIGCLFKEQFLLSAFLFAALLNFKHIFLYIAPAFGIYLLKVYCIESKKFLINIIKLITVGGICFAVSFGPFIQHMPQIISRLFPFKRGLTHAYWAPNFWAFYNFADKIISILNNGIVGKGINTGGLVQDYKHEILPHINPLITFLLTGFFMLPCILKLFFSKNKKNLKLNFVRTIVICSSTSFMFGWHVHEKAILMTIIPLCLLAITNQKDAESYFFLSFVGHFSLHPLLFQQEFLFIKYPIILAYQFASYDAFKSIFPEFRVKIYESLYLFGFLFLIIYTELIQHFVFNLSTKFPFLPLLLTSVYCSLGIFYFYVRYYYLFMIQDQHESPLTSSKKNKTKKMKVK